MAAKAYSGRALAAAVVMLLCLVGAANCECGARLAASPLSPPPSPWNYSLSDPTASRSARCSQPLCDTDRSGSKPSDMRSQRPGRAVPVGSVRGRILRCQPGRNLRAKLLPDEPQLHGDHRDRGLHAGLRRPRHLQRRRLMRRPSPALNADRVLPNRRLRAAMTLQPVGRGLRSAVPLALRRRDRGRVPHTVAASAAAA